MTVHKPWIHSHNTFLTATDGNFTLADKLNINHLAGLKAEAAIDITVVPRVEAFEPLCNAYHGEYAKHIQLEGEVKSTTQTINTIFHDLAITTSKAWVHTVAGVYAEGSDGFIRIFPKGRKILYKGTFVHRMAALDALEISLSTEAAPLDALYLTVKNFIIDLKAKFQD